MANYSVLALETGPGASAPDAPVILGMEFYVASPCWITAFKFWRPDLGVTGPITGRLWRVTGALSVSETVTFVLSGTGWHTATLITPVSLAPTTRYRVSGHFPVAWGSTVNYWVGADKVNGPLIAPEKANATGLAQGSFKYSAAHDAMPDGVAFNAGNYWMDVVVTDVNPTGAAVDVSRTARDNMLTQLGQVEPQNKSNIDLMREVMVFGGQTLVVVTSASAATHYARYCKQLAG